MDKIQQLAQVYSQLYGDIALSKNESPGLKHISDFLNEIITWKDENNAYR